MNIDPDLLILKFEGGLDIEDYDEIMKFIKAIFYRNNSKKRIYELTGEWEEK